MDNGVSSYRRFLDGDDSAIVEILKDYRDSLTLYINGYVGNIYIAEELMEETFFKIITSKPRFSYKSSFKTWLYAIGRNVALNYLRRAKLENSLPLEDYEHLLIEEQTVEREYFSGENRLILHKAMNRLSNEYRQVLFLVYFEDFTNSETAVVINKSKRQTENLIYRAKAALKKELEKEGFVYEKL